MIGVSVQGVVKRFGETTALAGIDVEIAPGELFFLLGPSGCGKTTLLRCLAGFYIPEEGKILFGDEDVTKREPHKRGTGMMFQSYALWPHMTVLDNVAFGLEQQKVPKAERAQRAREALASVQMEEYAERKPNALSGGQQQRVALARALVIRPKCLLLDEPLSNLDAKLRNDMRLEIRRICKEYQLTTIYVTHDQKEALSIADRMAVFSRGELQQVGSPVDVYRRPKNQFVADFIGEANFIPGKHKATANGHEVIETAMGEIHGAAPEGVTLKPGDSVQVMIRPEMLQLLDDAPAINGIPAKIAGLTYYGEVAHYDVAPTGGGKSLRVSEINPQHLGGAREGQIYATARPEDVVILTN
ncbi:ABC transporter ATP-binding protein [Cerasicoccus fimbriatus]|uniref:ABC transporter ATP-binding protein n=1 Tax=Cerasicoccus fimbriatus TaxID=3014554 RepID=UPI0022B3D18C|nr:ABC transporter ATP-binding protein [Cerasicoccus sp. TK19100]